MASIDELLADNAQLIEDVLGEQDIWHGKIFSVKTLDVELPNKARGYREIVKHHGGAAVVAIKDENICLVRQYRIALGRITLELPAGKLEPGEEALLCAARELSEETGLAADELVPLASCVGSPGFSNEKTQIFLAQGLHQGSSSPDEDEYLNCLWLPVDEVVQAIYDQKIQDAKTIVGVLAACTLRS